MTETYFTGTIERIIFENATNFYKILLVEINECNIDYDDYDIIVTGTIADVIEGEEYRFFGDLITHPKYGQQLQISHYERAKPSEKGLVAYFSSKQFKGIGRKIAEKIIALYGDNTIDKILASPEKLLQISGLSAKNRTAFLDKLRANYGTEMILSKLATYGITSKLAFRIQDTYKENTLTIIKENPYQLVEDITGMSFILADKLASQIGITETAPERFRAGLLYTLLVTCMETGDTYLEVSDLLVNTIELLEKARPVELSPTTLAQELTALVQEGKVQQIGTAIFSNSLYFAEEGIRQQLHRIQDKSDHYTFDHSHIEKAIDQIEKETGLTYDTIQKEAIIAALNSPIFILTGGPGTGKTTIINGIIAVYALLHQIDLKKGNLSDSPILLAAPTGRAARRMNEVTGLPSATIHRHLGLTDGQEESYREDYLEAELIIIDEFSMVDTWLAHQLFKQIATHCQVIIVGDADQLPSVSPGQVLADLLAIPSLPSIRLEHIYRQSADSTIINLANQIREGYLPNDFTQKQVDRSYIESQSDYIPALAERVIHAAISSGIPASEIQLLAPMYRGNAGIDNLNLMSQNLLNPLQKEQLEFSYQQISYRQGDRVIHLVNDTENNVFNGDLGYITELLPAKYTDSKQDELTIQFDGGEITYPRNEWYKLNLAYAMSIHKSQGSEFQVVILVVTRSSYRLLQRNLIYTAITRSKQKLILLGELAAFDYAVSHTGTARNTYLKERFQDRTISPQTNIEKLETQTHYQLTVENYLTIDPMIGLETQEIETFFNTNNS